MVTLKAIFKGQQIEVTKGINMSSVTVNNKWTKVVPNSQLKALVNDVKTVLSGNTKGFTLLEAMASVAILSIVLCASMSFFTGQIKVTKKLTTKLETATANANASVAAAVTAALADPAKKDKRVTFPVLNECKAIVGAWYGKRTDARVVSLYKSANCVSNYVGTLTALTNPTYDDTETDTFWNVSGDGSSLRMFVMKENL